MKKPQQIDISAIKKNDELVYFLKPEVLQKGKKMLSSYPWRVKVISINHDKGTMNVSAFKQKARWTVKFENIQEIFTRESYDAYTDYLNYVNYQEWTSDDDADFIEKYGDFLEDNPSEPIDPTPTREYLIPCTLPEPAMFYENVCTCTTCEYCRIFESEY